MCMAAKDEPQQPIMAWYLFLRLVMLETAMRISITTMHGADALLPATSATPTPERHPES